MMRGLAILVLVAGCMHPASATCGDGGVCPPGLFCIDTEHTTASGQICTAGSCGNGRRDPGEACDDGNNRSGDGCPADCTAPCGDGVIDPGEVCDDGNTLDGDGCAADCRSLDGIFLISPAVVAFEGGEGDPAPADRSVAVRLAHRGDTLRVTDTALPSWLVVTQRAVDAITVELSLHVTDAAALGLRSTMVPLTLHHADGSSDTLSLPVSYVIQPSDLAVQAAPLSLVFSALPGAPAPAQSVALSFNGDEVRVDAAPSWITVAPRATTSPAAFDVSVDTSNVTAGSFLSGDVVFTTRRGEVVRTARIHVDCTVDTPPPLEINLSTAALSFAAYAGGRPPAAQRVDIAFTGAEVSVVSAPPWLTVTPPADPTVSPASFTLSPSSTAVAADTVQSDVVVFHVTRNGAALEAHAVVDYAVRAVPAVRFVAPYVGAVDRAGAVLVTAPGLRAGIPVVIGIGALRVTVTPTADGEVLIDYPALAAGRYPVTLIEPVSQAAAELVIVAPPQLTSQAFELSALPSRMVYDAERRALYVADPHGQQILHFVHASGAWAAQPAIPVAHLSDIAMAPDGRSLLVLDTSALSARSLTDGAITQLMQRPGWSCDLLVALHVAGNGKVFLSLADSQGPYGCLDLSYDLRTQTMDTTIAFSSGPTVAISGDSLRIYQRETSFESYFLIYDATTDSVERRYFGVQNLVWLSISDQAARLIVNDIDVYDHSLRRLGRLPSYQLATAISRDARRGFVYAQDAPGPRLEVYDLDGDLQARGIYPLIASHPVPDPNAASWYQLIMSVAPDDSTVFIAGPSKLIIVPVP